MTGGFPSNVAFVAAPCLRRKCAEFGLCGVGVVLSFLLGLPLVLLHAERVRVCEYERPNPSAATCRTLRLCAAPPQIDHENFGFWISAMVVAMLGTLYYMYAERKQDDGTRM